MAKVSSRCLRYFLAAMLGFLGGTPAWRLHTGLCKFVQNISTNIWSLGRRTDLKLGEVSNLFISYNMIISNYFSIAWQCNPRIIFLVFVSDKYKKIFLFVSFILTWHFLNFAIKTDESVNLVNTLRINKQEAILMARPERYLDLSFLNVFSGILISCINGNS